MICGFAFAQLIIGVALVVIVIVTGLFTHYQVRNGHVPCYCMHACMCKGCMWCPLCVVYVVPSMCGVCGALYVWCMWCPLCVVSSMCGVCGALYVWCPM